MYKLNQTLKFNIYDDIRNLQIHFNEYRIVSESPDPRFKVHMNIKLENLFWVMEKLFDNHHLFLNKIYSYKISFEFCRFRILNQFSSRPNNTIFTKYNEGNFINEEEQPPNIIFYPKIDDTFNGTNVHSHVRDLINILKTLFPDSYNLSSNLFPRFNFRITDTIFLHYVIVMKNLIMNIIISM
jgi:hypothetical protein